MAYDYKVLCDNSRHIVLFVEESKGQVAFISKDGKEVGLHRMPSGKFHETYDLEYVEYPLDDYAKRTLNLQQYGVTFAPMAMRHLKAIISKEPVMAKPNVPVSTKAAPVAEPKSVKPAKEAKAPAAPKADGEKATRERREKLDGGAKIKVIGKNPARVGTTRHAIVETILQAKTVAMALDSTVSRKDGTDYKIGTPDIYFALEAGLIELV